MHSIYIILPCVLFTHTVAENDFYDVWEEIFGLAGEWRSVLSVLRIYPSVKSTIGTKYNNDPSACLEAGVLAWLRKDFDVKKYGLPSWQTLVKAVANPTGGKNTALAQKIAQNHPGTIFVKSINVLMTKFFVTYSLVSYFVSHVVEYVFSFI